MTLKPPLMAMPVKWLNDPDISAYMIEMEESLYNVNTTVDGYTSDNIAEGSVNLYYTAERQQTAEDEVRKYVMAFGGVL